MPRLTVTNLTNSPFDLEGGARLPAMGSVTGEFSEDYAALLRGAPGTRVEVATDPLDHDGDGRKGGSAKGARSTRSKGAAKKAVASQG
jgi:hypothetical protein